MLRMDIDQLFAQRFERVQVNRRVVYKCARLSVGRYFAAQNRFGLVIQVVVLKKLFQMKGTDLKDSLYHTFFLLVKKVAAFGPLTQDQRKRPQYDRFACACFAGKNIQAAAEADLKVID